MLQKHTALWAITGAIAGALILSASASVYYWISGGFDSVTQAVGWGAVWGAIWGIILGIHEKSRSKHFALGTFMGIIFGTVPAAVHHGNLGQWMPNRGTMFGILGPMMIGILVGAVVDRLAEMILGNGEENASNK